MKSLAAELYLHVQPRHRWWTVIDYSYVLPLICPFPPFLLCLYLPFISLMSDTLFQHLIPIEPIYVV